MGVELPVAGRCSARAPSWRPSSPDTTATTTSIRSTRRLTRSTVCTGEYCCGGGGGLLYDDRSRNQVQVALTKYAEKFGRHSLKFGLEIERSHVRDVSAALRAGRLLHLRLRRGSVLSIQLRIRHPGRQQAHVRVRSGSMDRRETDAEPRPAPGSHPRQAARF